MTKDEIIAMAKEAGFDMSRLPSIRAANVYGEVNDELAIFAALVAAKEREACALMCEGVAEEFGGVAEGPFVTDFGKHTHQSMAAGAMNGATAIRARGSKGEA